MATAIAGSRRSLAALVVVVLATNATPAAAQLSLPEAIKAAQLYKFASFVGWPDDAFSSPSTPLQLCVVGNPTVAAAVARAAEGQTVNGRSFIVRDVPATDADNCHIAYLSGMSSADRADVVAQLAGRPVLTVTDDAAGASRGVVNFRELDNRIRFEIDNTAATRNGLTVSSRLLALAVPR